jgi:D-methionine transport system substrate-binding protein
LSAFITGCKKNSSNSGSAASEKTALKIGTSSVSVDLADSGVKALENMGYKVEVVIFDDYFLPNTALVEGSLDANFYQHEAFMIDYNKSNNTTIVMMEPKLYEFYSGLYSIKADSLENLPDGGIVGIATDASNVDRDLRNLASNGIITLREKPQSGVLYSILDIVDNPHGYRFVESDHTKYTNMDEYTCLIGTSNTMAAIGVDPTAHLIAFYSEAENALGMCIMPENRDTQWAKDIMTAYTADESVARVKPASGFRPSFK